LLMAYEPNSLAALCSPWVTSLKPSGRIPIPTKPPAAVP
jgi:hypothetical protein